MTEPKITPVNFAMQAGLYLGGLGILKFLLLSFYLDFTILALLYIFIVLFFHYAVFYYARKFKYTVMDGTISFFQAWNVSMLLYFFSSLVTGAAEFIYNSYINKSFLPSFYPRLAATMQEAAKGMQGNMKNSMNEMANLILSTEMPTPIQWVFSQIQATVSYGIIAALIFAIILSYKKSGSQNATSDNNNPGML